MTFDQVDDQTDLYQVKNIIPEHLLKELKKLPLEAMAFTKQEWQGHIARRKLAVFPGSVLAQIQDTINQKQNQIGDFLSTKVAHIDSYFWYDLEGFTFPPHIDNPGVRTVMQIYLSDCPGHGTVFYQINDDDVEDRDDSQQWHYTSTSLTPNKRKEFEFKENTGYLMINNRRQLHGVPGVLGPSKTRLSVYCLIH